MIKRNERTPAELLADLTDRLLAGEAPERAAGAEADPELERAVKTIEALARGLPFDQPEAALRNRIRARLSREWQAGGPRKETAGWRSARQKQQAFALRFALGAVAVLLLAVFIAPQVDTVLPATAQGGGTVFVLAAVLLGILGLVAWLFRNRLK
jgi:anti-sigma factor RsiW